jgi:hypothetical protein
MKYDDIMKISNIKEKNDKLENFYLNDVNVLDWLIDEESIQKILFRDRFEVKKNGKYHNLTGPAIKWRNGSENYWIDGNFFEEKVEWEKIAKIKLRKEKYKNLDI